MDYKYSIIIPHYNDPVLLHKLIESIPPRDDIEVIVVDDNSKEALDLSEFSAYHLSVFINYTGIQSAGACRNIGLRNAKGKWLLFADADDFFLPDAFETIDNNINDESELFFFSPTSRCLLTGSISDRHIPFVLLIKKFIDDDDQSIRYQFVVPWSKVYRRSFIIDNELLFDEVIASNDVMFSLKTGHLATKIEAFKDTFYCVTRGKSSLTVNRTNKIMTARLLVELRKSEYINNNNLNTNKSSVMHCIKRFGKAINLNAIEILFQFYWDGVITFFPYTYHEYLRSPKKLYNRVFRKKKIPSRLDKKYHNK